ncbi:hypothetical protein BN1708_001797 [Verticillium longisporum]|uniref:Uncharacterized protein n=1 Tax=Verticillium longisporum TaxID=100787 RepID=A0A0G4N4S3_VERLO|nr:hypothetical protein BN1708_001797 [Verticillium longisporum]
MDSSECMIRRPTRATARNRPQTYQQAPIPSSRVSGAYRDEPRCPSCAAALAEMERRFGVAPPDLEHLVVQNTATPWRALRSSPPSPPPSPPPVEAFGEDGDL